MGWGSIFWRRIKVFALAIVIYLDYKKLQLREKWINNSKQDDLWEKAHECNARRVLNLIVVLEGLWVKLGQYLSIRADVLPPAYIQLLRKLQDSPPPCPKEEVFQTVTRELGKSIEELFMNFDNIPFATASIAQVHRATLHDGQEVVVKVQHEGIEEIILEDLEIAKSIVDWIAWAEPQFNFNPMIEEWFKEAPKELNFNHEAENTRKVSKNLGCGSNYDGDNIDCVDVLIPEVIMSTKKVLILEYIDGVRLNDSESLQALGVDKQKLVEEITRAYAHQIYVDGFFNCDPHPGNFLMSKVSPHRPVLLNFGLTKRLPSSAKQALAKMFLASIEGDYVELLSSFTEMGLKLRLNIPEQVTKAANMFFGTSMPAHEAPVRGKQIKRLNPVDAFPGDIITFSNVISLLRGLSSTMDLHVNIMRPFAESVLQCNLERGPTFNANWIHDTPPLSYVEDKVRKLLIQLRDADKVLGIQVCAYKDGEVIIDTAAGMLGRYDPRPVQPDSLFPVFSASKGITAGMVHWLVDKGMLDFEDKVENIWPKFGSNGKDKIKVHHVLNHTTGMHNALASVTRDNPLLMTEWDECLNLITETAPETEPGCQYLYHYLSFGWLCGGIIEHASGKRFQEILEEAFVRPLNIDGELYIGIPPGVESRLATLTSDRIDLAKMADMAKSEDLPSTLQLQDLSQMAYTLPVFCNTLSARRSIIPAANAHCSARALARYYAALVDQGAVPPPHSFSAHPLLGSHPHIPKFSSPQNAPKKQKNSEHAPNAGSKAGYENYLVAKGGAQTLFTNGRIHDALMGVGEYEKLTLTGGQFGLGFRRAYSKDGELIGFGHAGMGGATGYCDINNRFAIAVTLNKMNLGDVTAKVMQLVCSELNIPLSTDYYIFGEEVTNNESNVAIPLIK